MRGRSAPVDMCDAGASDLPADCVTRGFRGDLTPRLHIL